MKHFNEVETEFTRPSTCVDAYHLIMSATEDFSLLKSICFPKVPPKIYSVFTLLCVSVCSIRSCDKFHQSGFTMNCITNCSAEKCIWHKYLYFFLFWHFLGQLEAAVAASGVIFIHDVLIYHYRLTCFYPLWSLRLFQIY